MQAEDLMCAVVLGGFVYIGLDGFSEDIHWYIFHKLNFLSNGFAMLLADVLTSKIGTIYFSIFVAYKFLCLRFA
ncbi:hypothetical protein [Thalassotalea sp. SU-HH00458]|uniref:hypothetical protein n=1 Tax=Thalassotalea sp. SU-HH00458 TaxID=3127657 RepID=UPI003104EC94